MQFEATIDTYSDEQLVAATAPVIPATLSSLGNPNFLMCVPLSFDTVQPNNLWMQNKTDPARVLNTNQVFEQFQALYQFIVSQGALVHLMSAPKACGLQDLVFCANAGLVLHHIEEPTVIVSNFTSPPRFGETPVIEQAFNAMGYKTIVCPHKFEGEADLKHLYGNVYVGGYGMRSEKAAYEWMEANFDMKIIKLQMSDEYLYHFDCSLFPITSTDTMVYCGDYTSAEIQALEKYTNIIAVDRAAALGGITNSVRVQDKILNMSNLSNHAADPRAVSSQAERYKRAVLEKVCAPLGLQPEYFNLDEFQKGGAALSCMVMHLNRTF